MIPMLKPHWPWGINMGEDFKKALAAVVNFLRPPPSERFTCGDCDRNSRCGLAPHDDCLYRLTQIARDGERQKPPPDYFYQAIWPRRVPID
jgi:hypothetical protein